MFYILYRFSRSQMTAGNPFPGHYAIQINDGYQNLNASGSAATAADTLIHELLHVAYGIGGAGGVPPGWVNSDGSGPGSATAQSTNAAIISAACGFH